MVTRSQRSRSFRKVAVKTPGGKTVVHLKKRKPAAAKCGSCDTRLAGIPRARPYKMEKMPVSKKRPQRPFGGVLCSKCMRDVMITKARTE